MNKLFINSLLVSTILACILPAEAKNSHYIKNYSGNIIHIIKVDKNSAIKTFAKRPGKNLYQIAKNNNAWGAVNGGYFNHSDGYPVSKVIVNSKLVENPENNQALISNEVLKPILKKIFNNRVELRLTNYQGKNIINICPNNNPLRDGEKLINSIQAGPELIPNINLENEGFIIKNKNGLVIRDGIGSSSKAARSAVGIDKNGEVMLVSTSSNPGLTITELGKFMKELGAIQAMALDGGSSVSMIWTENKKYNYFSSMGKNLALINSAILIY